MPTLKELERRLKRIECKTGSHLVTFTFADGSTKKMLNSRVLQTIYEGFPEDGIRGRDYETVVNSVSNNADHRLIELFQTCISSVEGGHNG